MDYSGSEQVARFYELDTEIPVFMKGWKSHKSPVTIRFVRTMESVYRPRGSMVKLDVQTDSGSRL